MNQLALDMTLSDEEARAMEILRRHPGRKRAIQVRGIAACLAMDERYTRDLVRHLIDKHGAPIGSATSEPAGYYWIVSVEEAIATYEALRHRGISILSRAARVKGIALPELLGQLRLELEGE